MKRLIIKISILIITVVLMFSCIADIDKEVTISLSVTVPQSDTFTVKNNVDYRKDIAGAYDVNITKVTVVVKSGTTQIFKQDFSSLYNINFKLEKAGTYRFELYAYSNINNQTLGIFYATKDVKVEYGPNYIQMDGVFFKSSLEVSIAMDQIISQNWDVTSASLILTKNTDKTEIAYDLTSEVQSSMTNFKKTIDIDPGVWKFSFSMKFKNKSDGTEYLFKDDEDRYIVFYPSITEKYEVSVTDVDGQLKVNVRGITVSKPYIPPVSNFTATYLRLDGKMLLKWDYPIADSKTKFQVFQKLANKKDMELIAETTSTTFEIPFGEDTELINNLEYYAVNVVREYKESGTVEAYPDVAIKLYNVPTSQETLQNTTVKVAVTRNPSISRIKVFVNDIEQGSYNISNSTPRPIEFQLNPTCFFYGPNTIKVVAYDSWSNILAEDSKNINHVIWQRTYELSYLYDILEGNDGNFLVAGDSGTLMKISKDGELIWRKSFSDVSFNSYSRYLIAKADGGYLICGYKSVSGRGYDGLVFKIDENGNNYGKRHMAEHQMTIFTQ